MFKDGNRHYSLRKLSVGLASVLIGISFASSMTGSNVKADTVSTQTSAIETKTSENNNVDVNADASKEVVKSINSVNANKFTPSQTVLNKQVIANDLFKGTDIKQEQVAEPKQETPVKPVSTQVQPAVSNKDANVNLNSNFNKNAIKQALADNLLKDITKPETTNTLNVTKVSHAPIAENMLKENKTEVKENQDWADPAKQGFTKTTVGWTRNYKNYKNIAKQSSTIFMDNAFSHTPLENKKENVYVGESRTYAVKTHAVIDKNQVQAGKTILISSIPILKSSSDLSADVNFVNGLSDHTVVFDNKVIGDFYVTTNNGEADTFLHISDDFKDQLTKDLSITTYNSNSFYLVANNYIKLKGLSDTNPLKYRIIFNDKAGSDTSLEYKITPNSNKTLQYNPLADNSDSTHDGQSLFWSPSIPYDSIVAWTLHASNLNHPYHSWNYNKVIKIQRLADPTGYVNKINVDNVHISIWDLVQLLGDNNYVYESLNRTPNFVITAKALDEGLSSQQVQTEAKNNHLVYSLSKDHSSILIGLDISDDIQSLSKIASSGPTKDDLINNITSQVKTSYIYNIGDPANGDKYLTDTLNGYKTNDYNFIYSQAEISGIGSDKTKNILETIDDVTPNAKYKFNSAHANTNLSGANIDMSVYRTLNVKFEDDQGNIFNPNTFITSTGTDLTYNIKSADDPTFNSQTDIALPTNVLLADNQPTTVHYGMVKDTNPDIVIHVKHKILKNVLGNDKMLDNYLGIKKALNAKAEVIVNYEYPDNGKFTDTTKYPRQQNAFITLKRSADVDLTTDTIVQGTASKWSVVSKTLTPFYDIANNEIYITPLFLYTVTGYSLYNKENDSKISDPVINSMTVDGVQQSLADIVQNGGTYTKTFNLIYKADPQKIQVKFVDDDNNGKQLGDTITVNGVTDGQADFKDAIAAYNQDQAKYYVLAKDQTDPNTLKHTFIANDSTVLTVHLKHEHQDVTMSDPKAETTAEYRVIERMPGQYGGNKTIIDLIEHYHKQATKDLVTGVTMYGKYAMSKRSFEAKVGKSSGDYFFQIPLDQIVGYTTSSINAPSNEKDAYNYPVLNCFTYIANGVPTITLDIGTSRLILELQVQDMMTIQIMYSMLFQLHMIIISITHQIRRLVLINLWMMMLMISKLEIV